MGMMIDSILHLRHAPFMRKLQVYKKVICLILIQYKPKTTSLEKANVCILSLIKKINQFH